MKKVILIVASFAILLGVSCRETKTEKIIIEKQVESKADDSDGTSLIIDNKGVEFSTKNGNKKTEVNIK